jgi:hypothetical protein
VNSSEKTSSKPRSALSAILVIISVVTLVLVLAKGASDFAKERAVRLKDVEFHARILYALEVYSTANQYVPTPAHPEDTVVINGVTFKSGGAAMLYQVLRGDGSDQIFETAAGGTASDDSPANDNPEKEISFVLEGEKIQINGKWLLVDSFGHPVQYQKGGTTDVLNPKYDVWLYGGDVPHTDRHDAAAKRDPEIMSKWIRNFSLSPSKRDEDK